MAGNSEATAVGDTPVQLSTNPTDNRSDQTIAIRPRDGDVTLGFTDQVTFGAGWLCGTGPAADSASADLHLEPGDKLWAVADTGVTVQVAVLETGV